MPKKEKQKILSVDNLRHAEYYDMQNVFDSLYAKSKNGDIFENLVDLILKRENILLAYRNIKNNTGSHTVGTDNLTINDIGKLSADDVVEKVRKILFGSKDWGYRPRPVRRKEIPKPNGSIRPLGIPCIWDRLIQQCIKQIMEPICEAKFSNNSYGFRPNRSVENAIAAAYKHMQCSHLHYVVEFDIQGFFDNVNHSKLIKQLWTIGIRDKKLIWILKQILKAPIKMPNGKLVIPEKGTPQGGIISPLLANVVLNELDHWIESQWQSNPITRKYAPHICSNGKTYYDKAYKAMKKTGLKEMFIVRYADDFRIFCRNKTDAEKVKIAVTKWLYERLKLQISEEKTRVVNLKRRYSEFLGFKLKVHKKSDKYVVTSHMSDKALKRERDKLTDQAEKIARPRGGKERLEEIRLYNSVVMGIQNYYTIATEINHDCAVLHRAVMTKLTSRMKAQNNSQLSKSGRKLTETERKRFGKSKMVRYVKGIDEPIYPIGYIQTKFPLCKRVSINAFTPEGRVGLHDNLQINTKLMIQLMQQPLYKNSIEYSDNRISLFSAQWGKCAITGKTFKNTADIHCHHKKPKIQGGGDNYDNLILVLEPVHKLIHAVSDEAIQKYLQILNLNSEQILKLNELRKMCKNTEI